LQIEKTFHDIRDRSGVYAFMSGTLTNQLFSDDSFGYLNGYNKLLGGVRVRVQRHTIETCALKETENFQSATHSFQCYTGESKLPYGPSTITAGFTNYEFKHSSASTLGDIAFGKEWEYITPYGNYNGGGFAKDLIMNSTSIHSEMKAFFDQIESQDFLDPTMKVAFVEFVTYQPILKTYLEFVLSFEMSEGGTVEPSIFVYPFKMSRFNNFASSEDFGRLFLMIFTYGFVFSFVWDEIAQIWSQNISFMLYGRQKGEKSDPTPVIMWRRPIMYLNVKLRDPWEFIHVANIILNLVSLYYEISFYQEGA